MRSTNKVYIVPPYVVECLSASARFDVLTEDKLHIEMCSPHTVTQLTGAPKLFNAIELDLVVFKIIAFKMI